MVYLPSASLALGLLASGLSTTNALTARAGAIEPAILPGNADAQGFYFKTEKVNKTSDVPADGLYGTDFSLSCPFPLTLNWCARWDESSISSPSAKHSSSY